MSRPENFPLCYFCILSNARIQLTRIQWASNHPSLSALLGPLVSPTSREGSLWRPPACFFLAQIPLQQRSPLSPQTATAVAPTGRVSGRKIASRAGLLSSAARAAHTASRRGTRRGPACKGGLEMNHIPRSVALRGDGNLDNPGWGMGRGPLPRGARQSNSHVRGTCGGGHGQNVAESGVQGHSDPPLRARCGTLCPAAARLAGRAASDARLAGRAAATRLAARPGLRVQGGLRHGRERFAAEPLPPLGCRPPLSHL